MGPALGGGALGGGGLHGGGEAVGENEHGTAHATYPGQRPLLIQRPLHHGDFGRGQAGGGGQEHGGGIGGVQGDEGFGDLLGRPRPGGGSQKVPPVQTGTALGGGDTGGVHGLAPGGCQRTTLRLKCSWPRVRTRLR